MDVDLHSFNETHALKRSAHVFLCQTRPRYKKVTKDQLMVRTSQIVDHRKGSNSSRTRGGNEIFLKSEDIRETNSISKEAFTLS
jgi:hypothetical protein